MANLQFLYELSINGYFSDILAIFSFFAIISGILVILNKNPIVSVLFLIGLFASVSSYLIVLGLSFIGLSYLIVYIGAVSILFLFILMLINIRLSELQSNTGNSLGLGVSTGMCFIMPIYVIFPDQIRLNDIGTFSWNNLYCYYVTSKSWDGFIIDNSDITSIGNILYTNYSIWLLITSFILLLAMVGAIIITIEKKK